MTSDDRYDRSNGLPARCSRLPRFGAVWYLRVLGSGGLWSSCLPPRRRGLNLEHHPSRCRIQRNPTLPAARSYCRVFTRPLSDRGTRTSRCWAWSCSSPPPLEPPSTHRHGNKTWGLATCRLISSKPRRIKLSRVPCSPSRRKPGPAVTCRARSNQQRTFLGRGVPGCAE